MNPTKLFVLLVLLLATAPASARDPAEMEGVSYHIGEMDISVGTNNALPDLIVYRKGGLQDIIYENDDSLSLKRVDISTVSRALDSGIGAVVNFNLEFAKNSGVMTAEGNHTVGVILEALKYMKPGLLFEIQVHQKQTALTKRAVTLSDMRARRLINRLNNKYGSRYAFSKTIHADSGKKRTAAPSSAQIDYWPISIVNHGVVNQGQQIANKK